MLAELLQTLKPLAPEYWSHHVATWAAVWGISYLCGWLVLQRGVPVNYTRKVIHFAIIFAVAAIQIYWPLPRVRIHQVADTLLINALFLLYLGPFRTRSSIVRVMFASIDRPEDRPHTLLWMFTQVALACFVTVAFLGYFQAHGDIRMLGIVALVAYVGDGLAEPVGVRFGRHRYRTFALFTQKRFTRSLEGSACVFLSALIGVLLFRGLFSPTQFWVALLVVPPVMTLTEALSPHTIDSPFIFLAGGLVLTGISKL